MEENVLVCITVQENSRRLISQGSVLAQGTAFPLHILHISMGETIFGAPGNSNLLQNLFDYGSALGGEVHFLCSNNLTQTITDFIIDNHITQLVIGEAPVINSSVDQLGFYEKLLSNINHANLCHVNISVLSREDSKFREA